MNKLNHLSLYRQIVSPEVLIMVLLLAGASALFAAGSASAPPTTRRDDVVDDYFGTKVPDPYQWLEDQNSAETRAWITAQDNFSRPILDGLPSRDLLRQRLTALMNVDVIRTPFEEAGRYFFSRRNAGQDLYVLYMRQGLDGTDEVLLDPHHMSPDHSTSAGFMNVSKDGRLMAYSVRRGGKDEVSIHLMDIDSRHDLRDVMPEADYFGVSIKPDRSGFYYALHTEAGPRVLYHALGSDPASDKQIFGDNLGRGDIAFSRLSDDGRYLLIDVLHGAASEKTELYVQDLTAQTPMRAVVNDITALFQAEMAGDRLYIQTNWNAPNGRIFVTDLATPTREHWREVVPESDAVISTEDISGISAAGGKLFVSYVHNAHSEIKVFEADGREGREIPLPALGSASRIIGRWDGRNVFYEFSSFAQAPTIYRYDVQKGTPEVWARVEVPLKSDDFEVKQVWYQSKDETRVPMFIAYRKGTRLDGSNPTLLTGYGGFDVSLSPEFSAEAAAWVEGGGVYAVPNLRGGGEFGEKWHKSGMLQNKQNVFDDFLAAAQYLIDSHYSNPSKLGITGQSNGGLLVGAALTQRPDLFRAVVCRYPLLDMLRYENFLVARWWVPEYGTAAAAAEQFKVLYAYSPYQNVKPGVDYPAVLFVTGDGDTRVAPLHARKMAAMLQWATSSESRSERPVLLSYDTKSGHSGGRPLSKEIDELVDELSFFSWQLGAEAK